MATAAISFGTASWLASLMETGWNLTVVEHLVPGQHTVLRLVEDDFEPLELQAPDLRTVGVLATRGTDGVFVPCASKLAAKELLDRAFREFDE